MNSFCIINEALDVLQITQEQLSMRYFGRSHGYVSSIKALKRDISMSAMANLNQRLRLQIDSLGKQSLPQITQLLDLLEAAERVLMQQAVLACHGKASTSCKTPKPPR